jgi:hypothetical protein
MQPEDPPIYGDKKTHLTWNRLQVVIVVDYAVIVIINYTLFFIFTCFELCQKYSKDVVLFTR